MSVTPSSSLIRGASALLAASGGSGTVTSVSVTTANGISGSVATATTTPAITLTLGAITPTTVVASSTIQGTQLTSTIATGTAPLVVASTTQVANLNAATAGSATTATNVTVANEATDTTCFPIFATAATGDLPAKSNTSLTFNSNTGAFGATTLGGTLTTAAQSNVTSLGTLTGLSIAGTEAITSTSATAFTVGANGATNPALAIDASTASSATGIQIKSGTAASNVVTINTISSAADAQLDIVCKGGGGFTLTASGGASYTVGTFGEQRFKQGSGTFLLCTPFVQQYSILSSSPNATDTRFLFSGSPDSGASLTASTNALMWSANFSGVRNHATGALTLQQDIYFAGSTHSFTAASAVTMMGAFNIKGAPIAGNNNTATGTAALYIDTNSVVTGTGAATNSYGAYINAQSGATNNYITSLNGSAGEIFRTRTDGQIALLATNTAGGTTGAQTINKPSGTVNFAATATSLVVTNSLCTTSSIILPVLRTADATARIASVVPGSGSFTINLTAAATAETSCGFFIIN